MRKLIFLLLAGLSVMSFTCNSGVEEVTFSGHVYDAVTTDPIDDMLVILTNHYINDGLGNHEVGTKTDSTGYYEFKVTVDCGYSTTIETDNMMGYKIKVLDDMDGIHCSSPSNIDFYLDKE